MYIKMIAKTANKSYNIYGIIEMKELNWKDWFYSKIVQLYLKLLHFFSKEKYFLKLIFIAVFGFWLFGEWKYKA